MNATLPDGRTIKFPDGTPQEVIDKYIEKFHPAEPNVVERAIGRISKGVGRGLEMVDNFSRYSGFGLMPPSGQAEGVSPKEFFEENKFARQVDAHPETSLPGQFLGEALEFLPQIPIYTTGGSTVIKGATALPKVGKFAEALLTKGATPLRNYGKAIARGTVEGGVVGGTIGLAPGHSVEEHLKEGASEALAFGAAVSVLHPALAGLGWVAKGIIRKLGKKATPEAVEKELEKRAETDEGAKADLEKLRENMEAEAEKADSDELLVPQGTSEVPKYTRQGELDIEPLPPETIEKFKELGYSEADLAGRSDSELIDILDNKRVKPEGWPELGEKLKELESDKKNEPGISGGERGGETVIEGESVKGASEETAQAGRDVQALEGKTAPKEVADFLAGRKRRLGKQKKSEAPSEQNLIKGDIASPDGKVNAGIAERLGIVYNGTMGRVGKEVFLFTEPKYGATFSVKAGEDITAKLEAKVKEFEAAGNKPIEARPEDIEVAKAIEPLKEKVDVAPEVKEAAPEKAEAAIEKIDETKPETVAEAIQAVKELDDPTIDALIEDIPITKEEIDLSARRNLIAQRAAEIKRRKAEEAHANAPKTRKELETFLAEKRKARGENAAGKARRDRQKKEKEEWEKLLEDEGMGADRDMEPLPDESFETESRPSELDFGERSARTYEDIEDGVYLDSLGLQSIYEMSKKVIAGIRARQNAPSRNVASEVAGQKLTFADDQRFVNNSAQQIWENIKTFGRYRLLTPQFMAEGDPMRAAFSGIVKNPKVADHIYNAWAAKQKAEFDASRQSDIVMIRKTYHTAEQRKQLTQAARDGKPTGDPVMDATMDIIRREFEVAKAEVKDFLRQSFKDNLNEWEGKAMAEIISGKPIDQVIAKYENVQVLDKLGRRRTIHPLDEAVIRDLVKDYEAIDSWGMDNYMPAFEYGPWRIVSGGKLYAKAISKEDAARKFAELVKRDQDAGVERKYELDLPHYLNEDITGLSAQNYARVVKHVTAGIHKAIDDINNKVAARLAYKGLKGVYFEKPSHQFSPFMEKRRDILKGEEDIFDVLPYYFFSVHNKIKLDPVIDAIKKDMHKKDVVGQKTYVDKKGKTRTRDIKKPHFNEEEKRMLEKLVEAHKGAVKSPGDAIVDAILHGAASPRAYTRALGHARSGMSLLAFSYRPVAGFVNGLSGMHMLWTKVGTAYVKKAAEFMKTDEGKKLIGELEPYMGVTLAERSTGRLQQRTTFERWGVLKEPKSAAGRGLYTAIDPMTWFSWPEHGLRRMTVAASYLMAKEGGLSEEAARQVAIKNNIFIQCAYDLASLPEYMRGATMRTVTQYKPYLQNHVQFLSTLRGAEIVRYAVGFAALGGPRAMLIMAKSLPLIGMWYGWREAEEYMNKHFPKASRGVGGALGVDVSYTVTPQFPSEMREWVGPVFNNLSKLFSEGVVPAFNNLINIGNPDEQVDIQGKKIIKGALPIFKHWDRVIDQVVSKDGWVKDDRGRRIWHIDDMSSFIAKSMAGAEPIELSRISVAEQAEYEKKSKRTPQKTGMIDDVLDRVAKGEPLDEDMIDEMIRLGIKPSTLRRAARFRVLDPKMRRLIMTEVIRRPEILENYPDAADLE